MCRTYQSLQTERHLFLLVSKLPDKNSYLPSWSHTETHILREQKHRLCKPKKHIYLAQYNYNPNDFFFLEH